MPLPLLRTPRIELRPLGPEHLESLVELDSDPEVMRYLDRPSSRQQVEAAMAKRTDPQLVADGLGYWAGYAGETFLGWWGVVPPARWGEPPPDLPDVRQVDLGYRLMRDAWGVGYATEASRELLHYCFNELGLQRVYATTMSVNAGSRGVMEKLGMRYVQTWHPHFNDPLPDNEHGEVEYAITRQEWLLQQP